MLGTLAPLAAERQNRYAYTTFGELGVPLRWFGVKTVYRSRAVGKPRAIDELYDPTGTLVEERVVLFRARDHDEAINKGEKEAKQYAKEVHTNPYGQSVVSRRLSAIESFEVYDDPDHGTEVWSSTRLVQASVPNNDIVNAVFGKVETKAERKRRKKYLNREFSGDVKTPNTTLKPTSGAKSAKAKPVRRPRRSRLSVQSLSRRRKQGA